MGARRSAGHEGREDQEKRRFPHPRGAQPGGGSAPATPPDWVQEILESVAAAQEAAEQAAASAIQAAENTRGLAGWTLTKEDDDTVTIDYNEESEG